MQRTARFIMHIFVTSSQAITVQSNCYANFSPYKSAVWSVMRSVLFLRTFPRRGYSQSFTMWNEEEELWLQAIKRRVSLAWKPNWMPHHHVLKLCLTSLTPGRALDQLCHRIQNSRKISYQRKTMACSTQQKVSSVLKCHWNEIFACEIFA